MFYHVVICYQLLIAQWCIRIIRCVINVFTEYDLKKCVWFAYFKKQSSITAIRYLSFEYFKTTIYSCSTSLLILHCIIMVKCIKNLIVLAVLNKILHFQNTLLAETLYIITLLVSSEFKDVKSLWWFWRKLLKSCWTDKRTNKSTLEEVKPECSLAVRDLEQKLLFFGRIAARLGFLEKDMMLGIM
ncbi:Protein of unknown function, partial [Gryllus bimaculatus]